MDFADNSIKLKVLERLRTVSKARTWKSLAEELGINDKQLSLIKRSSEGLVTESGARNLPFLEILNWASRKGISIDWLLTGEGPEPEKPASNLDDLERLFDAAREKAASDPDFAGWLKVELKKVID